VIKRIRDKGGFFGWEKARRKRRHGFYAMLLSPALLSAPSSRKMTAATPTTTITVKKSPNVPSASAPAEIVLSAVVSLLTMLSDPSSASTIAPIPTMIESDTTASAIGPSWFTPLLIAILTVSPPLLGVFQRFLWAVCDCVCVALVE